MAQDDEADADALRPPRNKRGLREGYTTGACAGGTFNIVVDY